MSAVPRRPDVPLLLVTALLVAACGGPAAPSTTSGALPSEASAAAASGAPTSTTAAPAGVATGVPPSSEAGAPAGSPTPLIEQPAAPLGVQLAPERARVDLAVPTFSHPTEVTNPLFPVSSQASVLMLGHVEGKPFRTEVTLLPWTHIIDWGGQRIECVVSQYNAFLAGRPDELAYDLYAQADDGSVWYFGEDVFDFRNGSIATTEGTWQAGRDGPPAMIMPAHPKVGDVFRTENVPGFVFEQVTVKAIDQQFPGPLGAVTGGLIGSELHADGATEDKQFAPGYGEFYTNADGDVEALALAVPTDAASGPLPAPIAALRSAADAAFRAASSTTWSQAETAARDARSAWGRIAAGDVPARVRPVAAKALARLETAARTRQVAATRQAAIDLARSALDLELRYRPQTDIDAARFELWTRQIMVDLAARDAGSIRGDVFALDYLRDRFFHVLDTATATKLDLHIGDLQIAATDLDRAGIGSSTRALRTILATLPGISR